jgi:hypothetical protein
VRPILAVAALGGVWALSFLLVSGVRVGIGRFVSRDETIGRMKRTITGRPANRRMCLGDLRQFLASLESIPDEALIRARVTFGKHLRSITVEEDDVGFHDYVRAVKSGDDATSGGSTD